MLLNTFLEAQESLNNYESAINNLKNELKNTESDSLKCVLNFKISDLYRKSGSLNDYETHLEIANKLIYKNDYLLGLSYYYNAYKNIIKGDFESYLKILKTANELLKKYHDKDTYSLRATILNNQGPSYQRAGEENEYYRILVEDAMPLAEKSGDPNIKGRIYGNMAQILHNNRNYETSEYYYSKAILELEKNEVLDKEYLVNCYIEYAMKLIKNEKFEEVNEVLIKIHKSLERSPNSPLNARNYYLNGYYSFYKKEYEDALKSINTGINLANTTKDKRNLLSLKLLKSNTLKELKRYNEAKVLLIEYLNDPDILIGNKRDFTRNLAEVYIHLNDNKNAIKYFNRFATLSDSLDEVASRNVISKLEAKFNKIENEKKINELEAEKELALLSSKNSKLQNVLLSVTSVFLLVFTAFSWFYFHKNKKLSHQKEINYQQQLKELKQSQLLDSAKAIISGEENERKRVAQDLHDGLGGILADIKMNISRINETNGNVNYNLEQVQEKVDYSMTELRRIARNMMPESLLKFGLDTALKDICDLYRNPNIQIEYQSYHVDNKIPQQNQLVIYRIVQELLTNVIKHSKASSVLVQCSQNLNTFYLTVEDNGKGFNEDVVFNEGGMGINNIKNRVSYLGGKIEINSTPNQGTTINIELDVTK